MGRLLVFRAFVSLCLWATAAADLTYAQGRRPNAGAPTSYRNTAPGVAYVGSNACATCHATIYEEYRHTDMAKSLSLPHERLELESLQAPVTIFNVKLDQYFQVFQRGTDFWESEYAVDEKDKELFRHTEKLSYAMGTGENGVGYLIQRGDFLFQAPLAFYARTKSWELSPGFEAQSFGFGRPVTDGCIICHSGLPQPLADAKGLFRNPPFRELGIGCENCHGPGQLHVEERLRGKRVPADIDSTIVNPAKLPPWLASNICMYCHEQGDARVLNPGKNFVDFRPGTPLAHTIAIFNISSTHAPEQKLTFLGYYSGMKASKCYLMSRGRLNCLTCHDPHRQLESTEASASYRIKCLTCHSNQSCKLPLQTRLREEPSDSCVKCHMANLTTPVFAHTVTTDHHITARPGEPYPNSELSRSSPDAPDLIYVDPAAGEAAPLPVPLLLAAYRQLLLDHSDPVYELNYSKLLDKAAKTDPQNIEVLRGLAKRGLQQGTAEGILKALPYLKRIVASGLATPDDEFALGELLASTGEITQGISLLQKTVPIDPYNPLGCESLAISYWVAGRKSDAVKEIQQGLDLNPENQVLRLMLKKADEGPR